MLIPYLFTSFIITIICIVIIIIYMPYIIKIKLYVDRIYIYDQVDGVSVRGIVIPSYGATRGAKKHLRRDGNVTIDVGTAMIFIMTIS